MKTLAINILQIIACSGLLYGYYYAFLRNKKFHHYNRYYLLWSMALSLVVPFLKIPVYFNLNHTNTIVKTLVAYNSLLLPEVIIKSGGSNWLSWQQLLIGGYAAGAIILLFHIAVAIKNIIINRYKFPVEKGNNFLFINSNIAGAPFSFFKWIFWDSNVDVTTAEGQKILKHEYYHVQQKHSFDILFAEIICAVFFINPFFYFIKKELKAIHEFLADEYAGKEEKLAYAEMLVIKAIGSCNQKLVNPFFNNQLKRRINMLTTNQKTNYQYLRKLLVLPVLTLIAGLFIISCKNKDEKTETIIVQDSIVREKPVTPSDSVTVIEAPKDQSATQEPVFKDKKGNIIPGPEIYTKVDIDAAFPGGSDAWRDFLVRNLRGEVATKNGAPPGTYTTIVQFIVDREGKVSDVKALTNEGYGIEQEAVRVIKTSGKWKPAMVNGRSVKAYRKQPITFQIEEQ